MHLRRIIEKKIVWCDLVFRKEKYVFVLRFWTFKIHKQSLCNYKCVIVNWYSCSCEKVLEHCWNWHRWKWKKVERGVIINRNSTCDDFFTILSLKLKWNLRFILFWNQGYVKIVERLQILTLLFKLSKHW